MFGKQLDQSLFYGNLKGKLGDSKKMYNKRLVVTKEGISQQTLRINSPISLQLFNNIYFTGHKLDYA